MAKLELRPATLLAKYCKKWNVHPDHDYCHLYKDGEIVGFTLYRLGGMGGKLTDRYFLILKYIEKYYEDSITKVKSKKPHLAGHWCIMNQDGKEMIVFKQFDNVYLQGGLLYVLDSLYYNIETGECYGSAYNSIASAEFLFISRIYDADKTKRGVLKINKLDGSTELFPI